MEKPKDYYVILGVARNATTAAIKRAFRRLAKKLHPDLSATPTTPDFQDLQAAYETLADAASAAVHTDEPARTASPLSGKPRRRTRR